MIFLLVGMNLVLIGLLFLSIKRNQIQATDTEKEFKGIMEMSTEPLFVHQEGKVIYVNHAGTKLLGMSHPEQLINRQLSEFVDVDAYLELQREEIAGNLINREVEIRKADGTIAHLDTVSSTIHFNRQLARKVSVRDITIEKQKTEELETIAFQDELTGLLNRRGFIEKVTEEIESSKGTKNRFGVMFIDLDGFKEINDSLGHQVGDLVLQRVGDYLQRWVRKDDIVARLGGDEFVILLPDANQQACIKLAERIIEPNTKNVDIFGKGAYVTPSIGIALSPENGEDIETLIQQADMAMYEAKNSGKNQFRFADVTVTEKVS